MLIAWFTGTERCTEALQKLREKFDIVVNIQVDEPLIEPEIIDGVVKALQVFPCMFSLDEVAIAPIKKVTPPSSFCPSWTLTKRGYLLNGMWLTDSYPIFCFKFIVSTLFQKIEFYNTFCSIWTWIWPNLKPDSHLRCPNILFVKYHLYGRSKLLFYLNVTSKSSSRRRQMELFMIYSLFLCYSAGSPRCCIQHCSYISETRGCIWSKPSEMCGGHSWICNLFFKGSDSI